MRIDYLDFSDGIERILTSAVDGRSEYCCVPDVNECVICHDLLEHRKIVNDAFLVLSDSVILQRTRSLLHRVKAFETFKGAELMLRLCERAATARIPVALIGGKNEIVLNCLVKELGSRLPNLNISFSHSPPFTPPTPAEDDAVISGLKESGAKLIFVGLGCPKQERWMARHRGFINATMIGVGAAFDFISDEVPQSPAWVHKSGFEWLYRLTKEPKRLWKRYLLVAPRFIGLVIIDEAKRILRFVLRIAVYSRTR